MKISNLNTDDKVIIIAEIGNNHEGDFNIAVELIEAAAKSGVDCVKFQTFKTEHYVNKIQTERSERLKSFELSYEEFKDLSEISRQLGLAFISTPFDLESAKFLISICDAIKISSSDNIFYPLLKTVSRDPIPKIVSTGLANFQEVIKLVSYFDSDFLALLHCVSAYPVPENQINLSYIHKLSLELNCTVGYSDHSLGIDASALAVACGARKIEKHFTLDNNFSDFQDHKISSDPNEMMQLVKRIRKY
jgi:Sialic acid synthase